MGVVLRGDRDKPRAIVINAERGCEAKGGVGGPLGVGCCTLLHIQGIPWMKTSQAGRDFLPRPFQ